MDIDGFVIGFCIVIGLCLLHRLVKAAEKKKDD